MMIYGSHVEPVIIGLDMWSLITVGIFLVYGIITMFIFWKAHEKGYRVGYYKGFMDGMKAEAYAYAEEDIDDNTIVKKDIDVKVVKNDLNKKPVKRKSKKIVKVKEVKPSEVPKAEVEIEPEKESKLADKSPKKTSKRSSKKTPKKKVEISKRVENLLKVIKTRAPKKSR